MSLVLVEDRGAVRHLVLNRPEKRNALNGETIAELGAAVEAAAGDDEVRVVVVRGEGAMFSSGMDLNDLRDLSEDSSRLRSFRRPLLGWWNLLEEMPKPTICQIHGAALGGAFELALACDFRTMAEDAVAGIMEVRVGLLPDVGGCSRLPAVVGLGNAKELIMTGKVIDGREAHRIGFANRVAPAGRAGRRDRGALERAAGVRAAGGRARQADPRRGREAGALAHAGAGGGRPGDAGRERGLRRGRAGVLREARPGLRRALALPDVSSGTPALPRSLLSRSQRAGPSKGEKPGCRGPGSSPSRVRSGETHFAGNLPRRQKPGCRGTGLSRQAEGGPGETHFAEDRPRRCTKMVPGYPIG